MIKKISGNDNNGQAIIIRRADARDWQEVLALIDSLSPKDKRNLAIEQNLDLIQETVEGGENAWVADAGNMLAGMIAVDFAPTVWGTEWSSEWAILTEIMVSDGFRGMGIGSALLDRFDSLSSKTLAKTKANNYGIQRLLQKHGYSLHSKSRDGSVLLWLRDNSKN